LRTFAVRTRTIHQVTLTQLHGNAALWNAGAGESSVVNVRGSACPIDARDHRTLAEPDTGPLIDRSDPVDCPTIARTQSPSSSGPRSQRKRNDRSTIIWKRA